MRNSIFVFVHGAWHTPKVWDECIFFLEKRGFSAQAVDISLNNFSSSLTIVRNVLDTHKNIVLVGHSSAGLILQELANHSSISKLIFINAFILPPGLCQFDIVPKNISEQMIETAKKSEQNCIPVDEGFVRNHLMTNESEKDTQRLLKQLVPQSLSLFTTPVSVNVDKVRIPKYYIHCKNDVSLPPDSFLKMAELLGDYELIETDGGHETIFTRSEVISNILISI